MSRLTAIGRLPVIMGRHAEGRLASVLAAISVATLQSHPTSRPKLPSATTTIGRTRGHDEGLVQHGIGAFRVDTTEKCTRTFPLSIQPRVATGYKKSNRGIPSQVSWLSGWRRCLV